MFALITYLLFPSTLIASESPKYCIAIRGNGENISAHFGGLARMVEENGLPEKAAGGSSASVTLFFLDNIAGNPKIRRETNLERKRLASALLLKSLPAFLETMAAHDKAISGFALVNELSKESSELTKKLKVFLDHAEGFDPIESQRLFGKYGPLVNPALVESLSKNPTFFKEETQNALKFFGRFSASADSHLFLRPGFIDFRYFALILGTIGDFYAGNTEVRTQDQLNTFLDHCSSVAKGKYWKKIPTECQERFRLAVTEYLSAGKFAHQAVFEKIGSHLVSFPTTSVIKGKDGIEKVKKAFAAYSNGKVGQDFGQFHIEFNTDLAFGYWGQEREMQRVKKSFALSTDLKSQKFLSLGDGSWFEALSTSPAEPGLANIQTIPTKVKREEVLASIKKPLLERWKGVKERSDYLSAGGWSDLHPTAVLEASGCENVVYLTRKGGEAVFAQQVMIRLTGLEKEVPFWKEIEKQNDAGWPVEGREVSPWNRLYNLKNPSSSFVHSLGIADAVVCTDWNRFSPVKGEFWDLVEEAYDAPIFSSSSLAEKFRYNRSPLEANSRNYPGCIPPGNRDLAGQSPK